MYLIEYTGDGQTTEFEFSFPFFKAADVKVSINSELLVQGAFTVTFSELAQSDGMYSGGRVIFTDAPALGADIRIWRKIDLARVIDYQPTLPIQTESLNADFNFMLEYLKDLYELDGDVANIENGLQFLDSIQDQIEKLGNLGELAKKDEIPDVSNFATKDEIPDISNLAEKDHTHDMSEYATKTEVSTGLSSKQNSLTNAEMQAVDSGITESKVATYDAYAQQIAGKVNTQQGSANAGKVLQVGNDGNLFLSSEGSGILSVNHDNTLYGSGTSSDPLGVSSNERICNKIANCILQKPQNINLTLSNGVLTLKAGSTVYVPNGTGNFVAITTNADITRSNLSGTTVFGFDVARFF